MVLDIADLIIVKRVIQSLLHIERPSIILEFKIIPEEFAYNFVYIAGLRNFLAHEYLKETMPTLEDFLNNKMADIEKIFKVNRGKYMIEMEAIKSTLSKDRSIVFAYLLVQR